MQTTPTRRGFLQASAAVAAASAVSTSSVFAAEKKKAAKPLFELSLAEWSLHKAIFGKKIDHLDFAMTARKKFDIGAVEYVNQFFKDKAKNMAYLKDMKKRAADHDVKSLLIMIDGEGKLGDPNEQARKKSVENHYRWVEAAKYLGCHSIRVNAASTNDFDKAQDLAADGLSRLSKFAAGHGLNVIVENHGGLSSNGMWLAGVMKKVNLPNCGTLPDFGNFHGYDRYKGVKELMPFAKAVSAKSHDFDDAGNETHTDYKKIMQIVLDAGYHGYVGIEYEGRKLDEHAGILATRDLLLKVRKELA